MSNEPRILARDVEAAIIPVGTTVTLQKGEEAYITQSLGGSYTVIVNGNMFRIEGKDADALGLEVAARAASGGAPVSHEQLEKEVWNQLRSCYDPEIPVNIVDLGLIYDCHLSPIGSSAADPGSAGLPRAEAASTAQAGISARESQATSTGEPESASETGAGAIQNASVSVRTDSSVRATPANDEPSQPVMPQASDEPRKAPGPGLVTPVAPSSSYRVDVKMTLTAPGCGMGPMLAQDVQNRLLGLEGVDDVSVELVWDPPWNQAMMTEAAKLQLGLL